MFTLLSSETLAKWLGVLVLAYGLYSLWGTFGAAPKPQLPPRLAALLGGFGGGMTGTVVGTMGSVFFAMYFDAIRLAKDNYRATMTAILLTLTVLRGIGYWSVGEFTPRRADRHRDPVSVDAGRHLHRQPLPPRHERAGVPPHRRLRADRQRPRPAHQIGQRDGEQASYSSACRKRESRGHARWHNSCLAQRRMIAWADWARRRSAAASNGVTTEEFQWIISKRVLSTPRVKYGLLTPRRRRLDGRPGRSALRHPPRAVKYRDDVAADGRGRVPIGAALIGRFRPSFAR